MSNPISYFFSLSAYEESFRHVWLKRAIPYPEYERVWDMHITLLRDLYPNVYTYGPNGQHVGALIAALTTMCQSWLGGDTDQEVLFIREIDDLFRGGFPLHADILDMLQREGRKLEIYLYSPHPAREASALNMGRLHHLATVISAQAPLPSDVRAGFIQNIESLLSVAATIDLLQGVHAYDFVREAYESFLERWNLPQAVALPVRTASNIQESLSIIPDY